MKMTFRKKNFGAEAKAIVGHSIVIVNDYQRQGYKLSLRQLYYQLVSKNIVPNTERSYKSVGNIISDARMAGMVDWDMIEDRGRETITPAHWTSPAEIIQVCSSQYKTDKWAKQPNHCEVMVEKQALEGVLEPVCNSLDIPFTANKGYSSATMMFHTGRRLQKRFIDGAIAKGLFPKDADPSSRYDVGEWMAKLCEDDLIEEFEPVRLSEEGIEAGLPRIVVFYLGDHDPSGIDMTRDVFDRLSEFADRTPIEVRRLALNMTQIEELQPPENPAKMTDSRAKDYVEKFGESSWELDAVAPDALAELVRSGVMELRDERLWQKAVKEEERDRNRIKKLASTFK